MPLSYSSRRHLENKSRHFCTFHDGDLNDLVEAGAAHCPQACQPQLKNPGPRGHIAVRDALTWLGSVAQLKSVQAE